MNKSNNIKWQICPGRKKYSIQINYEYTLEQSLYLMIGRTRAGSLNFGRFKFFLRGLFGVSEAFEVNSNSSLNSHSGDGSTWFLIRRLLLRIFQLGYFCFNLLLTGIVHPQTLLTWHSFAWTQYCYTFLSVTLFRLDTRVNYFDLHIDSN